MSNANTRPEKIIDKNGHLTTRHKSIGTKTSNTSRASKVSTPAVTNDFAIFKDIAAGEFVQHSFNDEVFETAIVTRAQDGTLKAVGEFTIDSGSMEYLSDEVSNLNDYLKDNSEEVKKIIKAEYGASSVSINSLDPSITVGYEIIIDENITSDKLLDSFFETRGITLHSHANTSDKFSYALSGLGKDEDEVFEVNQGRFGFDDDI